MRARDTGDPRLEELFGVRQMAEPGVRPVVRLPRQGAPGWAIALVAIAAALLLFWVLQSRRTATPEPSVRARAGDALVAPEPPPLYIPPAPVERPSVAPEPPAQAAQPQAPEQTSDRAAPEPAPAYYPPQPEPAPAPAPLPPAAAPRTAAGPPLVVDTTAPAPKPAGESGAAAPALSESASLWGGRVRAGALSNRADTIPEGTLIPAVLETAFDSTSAGLARAIVSRDVRGFDGTRVLIPRGSRLIGEYEADVADGQKRALISWTRLIRPDGVTMALDSPATDTLGRGGVEAHVNNHTFHRLLNSILGTTLDIGGAVATRVASGPVLIAAPGMLAGPAASARHSDRIVPTLTVPAGTSISVFVARDLEFPPDKPQ